MDGPGRLPTFLVIGAMKAGTTSLARWLQAHPQVFLPRQKELHFFDTFFERGADWYRQQFAPATEPAVGEATPGYMFREAAVIRMAGLVPDARLVAVLRHPAERAWSQYCHLRETGVWTRDVTDLIREEKAAGPDTRDWFSLLARGRYLEQLERVLSLYPRERLLVLLFDDVRDQPDATFLDLCRFIGVDAQVPAEVGRAYNPRERVRSARLERVARRLPQAVGAAIRHRNRTRVRNPALPAEVRAELLDYFAPHNARLATWLGRDLSAWDR